MIDAFRRGEIGAKMSMLSNVQTYDIKNYENVKSFFEHIGLYLGLVAYTAAGVHCCCSGRRRALRQLVPFVQGPQVS